MAETPDYPYNFRIHQTHKIPADDLGGVLRLFEENYREANLAYLEKSLGKLRFLAVAEAAPGVLAGFALGESRMIDLPRLGPQGVRLAGLCCIGMEHRRRRLFGVLEGMALGVQSLPGLERTLSCGRMAHPASFRGMSRSASVVPKRGVTPTEWQQEVGVAIAEAYGTPAFDPATFVCKGTGVPIGFPVIDIEATPEEWELFAPVDRSRGDSLLGISWGSTPPPGW